MARGIQERNLLDVFVIRFCEIMEKHSPYIIVLGFLAIATGRTRATEDIDMIIPKLSIDQFTSLHRELIKSGFVAMQSDNSDTLYNDYLIDGLSIRYIQQGQPLPEMEVKFAKDALDGEQLLTRKKIPLTGLDIWFGSIEMNIAFKEELLKSPKDLEDARHLRIVFIEEINEQEIKRLRSLIRKFRC